MGDDDEFRTGVGRVRLRFRDAELRRLYEDPSARSRRLGPDLIRSYRKKVAFLANAMNEQDIRAMKSLRLEKLSADLAGQHSIRLNDQWRLILEFETDDDGRLVAVIEIADYPLARKEGLHARHTRRSGGLPSRGVPARRA